MKKCVFCEKFRKEEGNAEVYIFEPLNPVTKGHLLVVPFKHVTDFADDLKVSGMVMEEAARYVKDAGLTDVNIITSKGVFSTQTVKHLHLHIVPRRENDGLHLPWTNQKPLNK